MKIAFFANVAFCIKLNKMAKLDNIKINWRVDTQGKTETIDAWKLQVPSGRMKIFGHGWGNFVITPIVTPSGHTSVRLGFDSTKYDFLMQPGDLFRREFGIRNKTTQKELYYQFDTVGYQFEYMDAYGFEGLESRLAKLRQDEFDKLPFTFEDWEFTRADMLLEAIMAEAMEFNAAERRTWPATDVWVVRSEMRAAQYKFDLSDLNPSSWKSAREALKALEQELEDLKKREHKNWEEVKEKIMKETH